MEQENQPRLMRMKHVVSYTNLSRAYLYQKVAEGDLSPGHQFSPGVRAWYREEIDAWLDKRMGRA